MQHVKFWFLIMLLISEISIKNKCAFHVRFVVAFVLIHCLRVKAVPKV